MSHSPCPPTGAHIEIDDGTDTEEAVVTGTVTIDGETFVKAEVKRPDPRHLDTIGGVEIESMDVVERSVPIEFCRELPDELVYS